MHSPCVTARRSGVEKDKLSARSCRFLDERLASSINTVKVISLDEHIFGLSFGLFNVSHGEIHLMYTCIIQSSLCSLSLSLSVRPSCDLRAPKFET